MRKTVLHHTSERLLRHGAVILMVGLVAGCSGDMTRFTDGITTGSTNNQRSIIQNQSAVQNQTYQQNSAQANSAYPAMPAAPRVASGNVQRNELPPVGSAVQSAQNTAQAMGQNLSTQASSQVAMATAATAGASGAVDGLTVQPGESLYGVARRLGVSPNDLMAANNITDPNMLRAGQKLTVPNLKSAAGGALVAAATTGGTKVLGQLPASAANTVASAKQVVASAGGYTVQSGDTLHAIAGKTGVTTAAIKQANGMSDGTIRVGQSLIIPGAKAVAPVAAAPTQVAAVQPAAKAVQPAVDNLKTASTPPQAAKVTPDGGVKAYTPPQASNTVIEDAEKDVAMAPSATGISQMRWPVRGRVLTSFGQRDGGSINDGIDIMVPEGTAVKAAENGVVIYAGDGLKEFGNTVLVRHENGLVTVYGHNSKINVQRGQKVRRGEEIARSGMSGNAKAPKLHFEVRKNSTPVNPSKYLES